MNASFSILQKLKNQFFQTVTNKNDYHVAFAPFAFTLSNDDFYFLKNNIVTGCEAKKYLKEQSEFANIANSILKKPNLWSIDGNNLLYDKYKNILQTALTIDPSNFTTDETTKINKAKAVLFKSNGSDSAKYLKYKSYATKMNDLDKKIIDLNVFKNTINANDTSALDKWNLDFTNLNNEKKALLIEWDVKGYKSAVESAKVTYESIVFGKTNFIEKWNDAKNNKLSAPNLLTDEYGVDFLSTTCIPNAICDYQSPIWKKITLNKIDISQLTQTFSQEIPIDVLNEFGNLEVDLESINFEYCIIDIQRPWFDEGIINNALWKYHDNSQVVSKGDDSMTGEIPAYPVKIILTKNTELAFTPNAPVNEDIKNKLKNGSRLFFGPLLLKTIPINLANENVTTYRVQQLTNNELSAITKVAVENPNTSTKVDSNNKVKLMQAINHQPQILMRKRVEENTTTPLMTKASINTVNLSAIRAKELKATATPITPIAVSSIKLQPVILSSAVLSSAIFTPTPTTPTTSPPVNTVGKISGKVVDVNNLPLGVVEVQIMNDKNAVAQSVLTLEDGRYSFDNIEKGSYQLKVKKTTYIIQERKIDIQGNTQLDFLLEKEPIPTESFQIMGVICKKLPKLPNPNPESNYI